MRQNHAVFYVQILPLRNLRRRQKNLTLVRLMVSLISQRPFSFAIAVSRYVRRIAKKALIFFAEGNGCRHKFAKQGMSARYARL